MTAIAVRGSRCRETSSVVVRSRRRDRTSRASEPGRRRRSRSATSAWSFLLQPTGKVDVLWSASHRRRRRRSLLDVDGGFGDRRPGPARALQAAGEGRHRAARLALRRGAWRRSAPPHPRRDGAAPAGGAAGDGRLRPARAGRRAAAGVPELDAAAARGGRIEAGWPAMGAELTEPTRSRARRGVVPVARQLHEGLLHRARSWSRASTAVARRRPASCGGWRRSTARPSRPARRSPPTAATSAGSRACGSRRARAGRASGRARRRRSPSTACRRPSSTSADASRPELVPPPVTAALSTPSQIRRWQPATRNSRSYFEEAERRQGRIWPAEQGRRCRWGR